MTRPVLLGFLLLGLYVRHLISADLVAEDWPWMRALHDAPPTWSSYRPLTAWSLYIHTQAWPCLWVTHATNLALHGVGCVILWRFLRGLGISRDGAWAAVTLWSVHPLTVETVAYLSSRGELWTGLAILAAGWLATGPTAVWAGIPLVLGLGILGKEFAVLGVGLVALVWWTQGRRWPAYVAGLLTLGVLSIAIANAHIGEGGGASVTWVDWLLLQSTAAHRLLTMTVIPSGMTIDYDYDAVAFGWRLVAVGVLVGLAVLAWTIRQHAPLVSLGLGWMLLVTVPRLIVRTPRSFLNEHQFYAALIGWAVILGATWDYLSAQTFRLGWARFGKVR